MCQPGQNIFEIRKRVLNRQVWEAGLAVVSNGEVLMSCGRLFQVTGSH